jgi:arabinose-5-phosphate isomerase
LKLDLYLLHQEEIIEKGKQLLDEEIRAISMTKQYINESFYQAVMLLVNASGKVIVTGIGKSGHVSRKIAATMVSLGIPAVYLNPAEAIHGDLGIVQCNDIVIAISKSGESQELLAILPLVKSFGAKLIGITSNPKSSLGGAVDLVLRLGVEREAGHLNLAPTSSVLASLAIGDALATVASELRGFKEEDFAVYHPGGAIGARLNMKVEDLLSERSYSAVDQHSSFKQVLIELTSKSLGATVVLSGDDVVGIITDGDLKRVLERYESDFFSLTAMDVMKVNPIVVNKGTKVIDAVKIMEKGERPISVLPVLDGSRLIGILRLHDILNAI